MRVQIEDIHDTDAHYNMRENFVGTVIDFFPDEKGATPEERDGFGIPLDYFAGEFTKGNGEKGYFLAVKIKMLSSKILRDGQ